MMLFNSIPYWLFFLGIFIAYYGTTPTYRWIVLLLSSLLFYGVHDIRGSAILVASTAMDYVIGLILPARKDKKFLIALCVLTNITMLITFKYFAMVRDIYLLFQNWTGGTVGTSIALSIVAPLGISFFTFKKVSYVLDVAAGRIAPEKNFGHFFLYVVFFLEVVSGPIDRASSLMPQFKNPPTFNHADFQHGLFIALCGLVMKTAIADRLATYTDVIFNDVYRHGGPTLLTAAYFYSFQIYADFAGYSLIAIGCGRMLGINIAQNFNLPYFSASVSEFWRRWHMTLSQWFRDYLYIPLGGNRVSRLVQYRNLTLVFLLCGLWHGANWTFVVWGCIHGIYLVFERVFTHLAKTHPPLARVNLSIPSFVKIVVTFHLITLAWIFFRANNITEALFFIKNIFHGWPNLFIDTTALGHGFAGILSLIIVELLLFNDVLKPVEFIRLPLSMRWSILYFLLFMVILFGVDSDKAFIYVQF